jgi:hypothetical protein
MRKIIISLLLPNRLALSHYILLKGITLTRGFRLVFGLLLIMYFSFHLLLIFKYKQYNGGHFYTQ